MIIVLSQKIDSDSTYSGDDVFKTYHYPKNYRNQIHTGDIFIYYQGNRCDKSQRYYFGTGRIGKIIQVDDKNYYAELLDTLQFENKVSIYLPGEGYVESIGYEKVRNSINPPWQSSIRPLSDDAYKYILQKAGIGNSVEDLDSKLKKAIQKYYISKDKYSVLDIIKIAKHLAELYNI